MSEGKPEHVYQAICEVAAHLSREGIAKEKTNQQQGYRFRGIDDVYNALSAVLAEHRLCILPRVTDRWQEERATKAGGVIFGAVVKVEYEFVSAVDGSRCTVVMYGEGMDTADKATNKAMSAAYKYCAMQTFCIPVEGMDDADQHTPAPAAKMPRATPAPKVAPAPAPRPLIPAPAADQPADDGLPASWKTRADMEHAFGISRAIIGDKLYSEILSTHDIPYNLQWTVRPLRLAAAWRTIEAAEAAAAVEDAKS